MKPKVERRSLVASSAGLQLEVIERGDPSARGIMFIHGFGQSHLSFCRQFDSDALASYHLVAFDLRGHGGSDKPRAAAAYQHSIDWAQDVAAVMKATHMIKPTIVAWSYGGYVAADYVRHFGVADIGALNLVGSSAGLIDDHAPSAQRARSSLIPRDIHDLYEVVRLGKDAARRFACVEMTEDECDLLFATEMMMPNYVRASILTRDLDNADIRTKLAVPVLLSFGTNDGFISASSAETLASRLPYASVSAYQGVGHLPFMQCSSRFDAELSTLASR